ncbi:MAG TPA: CvpA family protein [Anaeromyxobacter sp.]
MSLDLAVLAVLAVAALLGASSGALRQLVSLAAALVGVVAARVFGHDVGEGIARSVTPAARGVAPLLLFLGAFALASLVGLALLRWTGLARAVRGPLDRAAGALLGGAKAAVAAWALLSALALAGDLAPDAVTSRAKGSDFAALARAHNLVARLDANAARRLERALEAARRARAAGALASDPDSARLLDRVGALEPAPGGAIDPARAAKALEDPEVRALVERLAGRAGGAPRR